MKIERGVDLWNEAKKIIPGGTQLLSKRSEQFLPDQWPSYYKRAKGVEVHDLDGRPLIDMSLMGVGTCILGYADVDVNRAVKDAIDSGSMTTLNCYEDVELAALLLKINPWADMVRYARTGGEAMAVAVRLARAFTKKDKVAFCGYHGWHDWYLAANLSDKTNLDQHLLPGLEPSGVPTVLAESAVPFSYNDVDELEAIARGNTIGTIVVEPVRHDKPKSDFLANVREIAVQCNAVLIFDEITSGWRMNVGGIHELYGVYPDIAVYGKAMSNGFPMAAVVGRQEVMSLAETCFISSTYWTERIGPVASLATINKMHDENVPPHLIDIGQMIGNGWRRLADENELKIEVMDAIPPLTTFSFLERDSQALITLFTQEMLDRGFLASKSVYVSYAHSRDVVQKYLEAVDEAFFVLKQALERNNVLELVRGPIAQTGFKRLTR